MPGGSDEKLIKRGVDVADSLMFQEDKIWSRHSNDKIDIGEELAKVIRALNKAVPLKEKLRGISIGSSDEPQFRILETAFRGGLYLLDMEKAALDIIGERILRQYTDHVTPICADYTKVFIERVKTGLFLKKWLKGKKVNLITMHHSLYYSGEDTWQTILENLYTVILSKTAAVHIVLMAAKDTDEFSTTWLYNHFAGKYFGHRNNQDLLRFASQLRKNPVFSGAQILVRTNRVKFFVDDFEKFMAVIWMILLYPHVHLYSRKQREEITEFVYKKFWKKKRPLIQSQQHLVVYKGLPFNGIV
ncbi:MAG: class I SAM-dependent methyltransferase [Candidatus Omnitrophota bacterium]